MRRLTVTVLLFVSTSIIRAQDAQFPAKGSWGGELCYNCGVSVLRFTGPSSAWLFGVSALYQDSHTEITTTGAPSIVEDATNWIADARFGLRAYRPAVGRVRPYVTLGAIFGLHGTGGDTSPRYGAFGDFGGAYFFSPHVSLGIAATLNIEHFTQTQTLVGTTFSERVTTASINFVNLLASVYF